MTADHAPDYRRGYLRVPLPLWAELYCRAPLTRRQLQLISVVLRESWGWQRRGQVQLWTRPLAPRQLAQLTGLSTDHLRRDLQALVQRGVLREQDYQYQLVPDPGLWKTRPPSAPKQRAPAPKPPAPAAKTALFPPDLKIVNKKQRNEGLPVDKSASPSVVPESQHPFPERLGLEARFGQVVEAFVGTLSAAESQQLRQWIARDGVALVWHELEDAFRRGPRAVRHCLQSRWAETSAGTTS
jgi:hypothetical protein